MGAIDWEAWAATVVALGRAKVYFQILLQTKVDLRMAERCHKLCFVFSFQNLFNLIDFNYNLVSCFEFSFKNSI